LSAFDADARIDVNGRFLKMQDRAWVHEEGSKGQEGTRGESGWVRGAPNVTLARWASSMALADTASLDSVLDCLEVLESRVTGETRGFWGFNFPSVHNVMTSAAKQAIPTCAVH
jgi:hypothetical protein